MTADLKDMICKKIQIYPIWGEINTNTIERDYLYFKDKKLTIDLATFDRNITAWRNRLNLYKNEPQTGAIFEIIDKAYQKINVITHEIDFAMEENNLSRIQNLFNDLQKEQVLYFIDRFSEEYMRRNVTNCTIQVPKNWIFNYDSAKKPNQNNIST